MKAELISIGSEITSGQNLDTNCQWLSQRLAEDGIPVGFHTTVADDFDDNVQVFHNAVQRAKLVLSTGGLGPTLDDLTREVLAKLVNVPLVEDPVSLQQIRDMFTRRGREMPERNRVQALFPQGAMAIFNANGTAPGIWMQVGSSIIACMPGVPSEMKLMYEREVRPRLMELGLIGGVVVQRKINTFGWGESAVEEKVSDLTRRGHVPEVGITASDAVISLRIIARGNDFATAQAQYAPIEAIIRERLGELVFGVDHEELHEVVVEELIRRKLSISTAESLTAGLIANRIGQVPGASSVLHGGFVTYTNETKQALLGVPGELLAEHGAVSEPVARAMAIGCRERLQTNFALSSTGLAGPTTGGENQPVGTVFVALAWDGGCEVQHHTWGGTRTEIQSRTAKMALNLLRLHLLRKPN
ncbi:MAG: competence/damage-inducible protein A [Zavarzinella sp.]